MDKGKTIRKAVILAGGKGTRLQGVRTDIPKPMMPLNSKPLLQYLVELCTEYQITEIWITVNHLKDSIVNYFGNGSAFGVTIHYFEENEPLGTVGGVKAIEQHLQEDFLVLYGDVMVNMNLHKLFDFHYSRKSDATLVVHPNDHPYDSDLLELDENDRVTHFFPKPHDLSERYRNVVNAAAYVFTPKVFSFMQAGKKADFGSDIFPEIIKKLHVYGYNTTEYLKDMGTPDRLKKVEADLFSGKIASRNLTNKQKAVFLDRDGVINYDTDLIKHPDELTIYPFTAAAIKKINQSGFLAIVVTNQSVIARGLTDLHGLNEIHKKLETQLGKEGAFLDAIYYCPHHPDRGFPGENPKYKVSCTCRKPSPGMLLEASDRFNIDLSESWMIGDSERDVLAGRSAGVRTIGVKTGHGIKKTGFLPDFFMTDLAEAVDFILEYNDQQVVESILHEIKKINKSPFVISIGGNTRSGKSTLAQQIKSGLEQRGMKTAIIHLDDWIVPSSERNEDLGVLHNFNHLKLEADLTQIFNGHQVVLKGYSGHTLRDAQEISYSMGDNQIIVIEGVIALHSNFIRQRSDFKIFKSINFDELKKRFDVFYSWKGLTKEESELLYARRLKNEYENIAGDVEYADWVI